MDYEKGKLRKINNRLELILADNSIMDVGHYDGDRIKSIYELHLAEPFKNLTEDLVPCTYLFHNDQLLLMLCK